MPASSCSGPWPTARHQPRAAPAARPARPIRTAITLPPHTTLALGRGSAVALSPDGMRVVYAARAGERTMLYRRDLDRFESVILPGSEGATNPFFSPDGRWVGFFADRLLKKVSLDGGAPVTINDAPNPRGEAWGEGETILITPTNGDGLARVSAAGATLAPFSTLTGGEASHRWPRFLPGRAGMLFSVWNDTGRAMCVTATPAGAFSSTRARTASWPRPSTNRR